MKFYLSADNFTQALLVMLVTNITSGRVCAKVAIAIAVGAKSDALVLCNRNERASDAK